MIVALDTNAYSDFLRGVFRADSPAAQSTGLQPCVEITEM
jgi:hypothetical protein